jgi:transcriptional regulator with XRE-family HTH domain
MPLDLVEGVTMLQSSREDRDRGAETGPIPSLASGPNIGAALRAIREARGLTVEDVSEITRVRPSFLTALEEMRLKDLPSRPFVVGYLRAYAQALDLDPDAAVGRFRAEHGDGVAGLSDPIGVRRQGDPRVAAVAVAGVVIIAAIALWNVARRAMQEDEPPSAAAAEAPPAVVAAAPPPAQVSLGEPLPAPAESTRPDLYVTPGLADAAAAGGAADAVAAARKARAAAGEIAVETGPAASATFKPGGTIHGEATPGAPAVILQARRPAALVVQSAGGAVHFARQMAAGEAYRVPTQQGLTTDVSDPAAFAVYVDGVLAGPLPAAKTSLARLASAGPPR